MYLNSLTFLCQAILYISVLEGKAPWARGHPIFFLHFRKSEYFFWIFRRAEAVLWAEPNLLFLLWARHAENTREREMWSERRANNVIEIDPLLSGKY